MEQVEFAAGQYVANALSSQLNELKWLDPVSTYRTVLRLTEGMEHNEGAAEPPMKIKIVYRDDDDFKIKGKSYFLLLTFLRCLVQWSWTRGGGDDIELVPEFKLLLEQVNQAIEAEDVEFDTQVSWTIETAPYGGFNIKVKAMRCSYGTWASSI